MTYDDIYNEFYLIVDPDFFRLDKEMAYEYMRKWIHDAISNPYIRELFSSVSLDDEIEEITYTFRNPSTVYPDDMFLKEVLSSFMKIQWITSHVDSAVNMATVIGGDNEKKILDNYKNNMERLKTLRREFIKLIKDFNSSNNSYVSGES